MDISRVPLNIMGLLTAYNRLGQQLRTTALTAGYLESVQLALSCASKANLGNVRNRAALGGAVKREGAN